MAYTFSKRHRRGEPDHTSSEIQRSLDPGSLPNSAMLSFMNQRPAAEQEADRLSEGVTSMTPDTLRREMGERLGADFSGVRFHNNEQSAERAENMGARAFTEGRDIYFGSEGFSPRVAAHEMVHTVQQGAVKGDVSQSVPMGTTQMWSWPWKRKKRRRFEPADLIMGKAERLPENEQEKNFKKLERLFRIQAGLSGGNPNLVSDEDKNWHKETMKNLSPEMIQEILKRRDQKSIELMNLRNSMEDEDWGTHKDRLNYNARNSAAAYDMNIYHMLASNASKVKSNRMNYVLGSINNLKTWNKDTAAAVRNAYALMRDRNYNRVDETREELEERKQGYRQMSAQIYTNKNLYVDYSSDTEKLSNGWNIVGKDENNEAQITGETNIVNEGFREGEPKEFIDGEQSEANKFFGYGNEGVYDEWEERLKLPERTALADYTGKAHGPNKVNGNYYEINEPLRDQVPLNRNIENRVEKIKNAMNKYELGDDLIVYRGCDNKMFGGLKDAEDIKKCFLGRVVRDRGFVSTSAVKGKQFTKMRIQLKIKIPRGKGRGAFISPLSHFPKEHEFLLKNNSSFRVTDVYSDPRNNYTWVEMDLLT